MRAVAPMTALACLAAGLAAAEEKTTAPPRTRAFEFTYAAVVRDVPAGAAAADVWLPLPPSDEDQTVTDLRIDGPVESVRTEEKTFGNRIAYFHVAGPGKSPALEFRISFQTVRKEVLAPPEQTPASAPTDAERADRARDLQSERLCVVNDRIRDLAREITAGREGAGPRGRAIYDYVQTHMRYDKTGTGWGNGDTVFACAEQRGNCTDFHALFISLARAAEIPALFEMGFPLPTDRTEGPVAGYHCWTRFYQPGRGWIPVDASEGWKQPSKRDYFFGALDENRVRLTRGRDLVLEPAQKGPPLNYFIYPYVEVDGKAHAAVDRRFSFRDLKAAH